MPLEKIIEFNKSGISPYILFKNIPISVKNFTIRSKEKIYYNILINNHYLINFQEYDYVYDEDDDLINVYQNCISSEYDELEGYYNYFKFDKEINIEAIEIENLHPDFEELPDIYFEYDDTFPELDRKELHQQFTDMYFFKRKYFKFFDVPEDYEIKLLRIFDGTTLRIKYNQKGRKTNQIEFDENKYKFKHLKDNTYYVEFDKEQCRKIDHIYSFNFPKYISSYYPLL